MKMKKLIKKAAAATVAAALILTAPGLPCYRALAAINVKANVGAGVNNTIGAAGGMLGRLSPVHSDLDRMGKIDLFGVSLPGIGETPKLRVNPSVGVHPIIRKVESAAISVPVARHTAVKAAHKTSEAAPDSTMRSRLAKSTRGLRKAGLKGYAVRLGTLFDNARGNNRNFAGEIEPFNPSGAASKASETALLTERYREEMPLPDVVGRRPRDNARSPDQSAKEVEKRTLALAHRSEDFDSEYDIKESGRIIEELGYNEKKYPFRSRRTVLVLAGGLAGVFGLTSAASAATATGAASAIAAKGWAALAALGSWGGRIAAALASPGTWLAAAPYLGVSIAGVLAYWTVRRALTRSLGTGRKGLARAGGVAAGLTVAVGAGALLIGGVAPALGVVWAALNAPLLFGQSAASFLLAAAAVKAGIYAARNWPRLMAWGIPYLRKWARHTRFGADDFAVKLIEKVKALDVLVLSGYVAAVTILGLPVVGMAAGGYFLYRAVRLAQFAVDFWLGWTAGKVEGMGVTAAEKKAKRRAANEIRKNTRHIRRLIWFPALLFGLPFMGLFTGLQIGMIAGIVGIGPALAAKPYIQEIFGYLQILMTRKFVRDDWIILGDGKTKGRVESIDMFSTRLIDTNGKPLIVPNSYMVKQRIANYGQFDYQRWSVDLAVSPDISTADLERVQILLKEVFSRDKKAAGAKTLKKLVRVERSYYAARDEKYKRLRLIYYVNAPDFEVSLGIREFLLKEIESSLEREWEEASVLKYVKIAGKWEADD